MKKLFLIPTLFILLTFAFQCESVDLVEATIVKTAPLAADGCGWVIEVEGEQYKAKSLSEKFLEDGLKVKISYKQLDEIYQCGMIAGQGLTYIEIEKIKKA